MDNKKKPQQRTIDSRNSLLAAAYELFNEKGYYNTNSKEIATVAGISIGNFYNYFADKSEIFCCLMEMHFNESVVILDKMINDCLGTGNERDCRKMLGVYIEKMLNRSAGKNRFLSDVNTIAKENEKIRSLYLTGMEKLIGIIEHHIVAKPDTDKYDCHIRARMIYIMTEHIAEDIMTIKDPDCKKQYIEAFFDEIMHHMY